MPGQNQQTQQQTQSSVTAPWEAAQPLLKDLISKYSGQSTDVTGAQSGALSSLVGAASGVPNFGNAASGAVNNLFNSSTAPQIGMLTDALSGLKSNIGGTASGAELDPYSTPGFSDALGRLTQDITNTTKGVYAGSGRDPSGAGSFAGSLARGLTQGEAPIIAQQYNTNKTNQLNAASTLFGAGDTTAGAITGQNQVPLTNAATALGLTPAVTSAYTNPAMTQLAAANAQYSAPWTNLAQLACSRRLALGRIGGQSSGTGTSVTTQPQSTLSNILGGISGGVGLLSMFSDKRLKTDIAPVGKLHDGQDVVRFRFKGEPTMRIGLLAQDVAKREPGAVHQRRWNACR
jgi:hypothetical protein